MVQFLPTAHDAQDNAGRRGRTGERSVERRTAVERIGKHDAMRFLKFSRRNESVNRFSTGGWGDFTAYLEIDDQLVTRQVNVYAAGPILRYDRSHWCDDFGVMWTRRFSRKQKAANGAEVISAVDFEAQWESALRRGIWSDQRMHSRQAAWGTWEQKILGQFSK